MKPIFLPLLLILISCTVGCHHAATTQIHGTPWSRDQVAKLTGWWNDGDGNLCRISPQKNTGCVVCWLDREDDKVGFAAVNMECTFTRLGEKSFVFGRMLGVESKGSKYGFAYVMRHEEGTILIAYPRDEVFLQMIESGRIGGGVQTTERKDKSPLITDNSTEFLNSVEEIGLEKCFQTDKPLRLTRVLATREE